MALDNPSYFSVATDNTCKQKMGNSSSAVDTISRSSNSSLSRLTPPQTEDRKRTIRTLLRSVSTNSGDSNQELLIMGEPRLSDIAPDLTFAYPREPRRANSLKNNSVQTYSALAASEEAAVSDLSDDEEVFLNEESARYYNLATKTGSTRRRHSISTFTSRERTVSVTSSTKSFKEDFPQAIVHATPDGTLVKPNSTATIDDHSLRHGSYPRKRCNRCTRGQVKRSGDMDDILIISVKESSAAILWVEYFTSYFEQISKQANRKPFKVHHLGIEDIIEANGDIRLIAEKITGVKLQLVVICPTLLEKISENNQSTAALSKILLPDRTLALQLGTTDNDITDIHKNALSTYAQWQRRGVGQDQDENFAKEFVSTAMAIFSKVWKQQSSVVTQENAQFSVSPKKIRQGQNSLLILLTYPLQKEDVLKISIEKNNDLIEVKSIKRRNPYTIKISIPDTLLEVSAIVNILVEKNGHIIGSRPIKCESRLRELEQILRSSNNPVEFMCQTLGFSPHDTEQLDNWMVHMFQKNVPSNFNLFVNNGTINVGKHSCEEYPTLLHFAARFGLEKLTMQLLDCPGGDVACEIRNISDLVPADIAERSGNLEIAHMLRGYMKMNEFTSMYTKLKDLTTNVAPKPQFDDEEAYLIPRRMSDLYKICPAPKPFCPSSPSPTIFEEPAQYLVMNLNNKADTSPVTTPTSEVSSFSSFKPKPKMHASQTSIQSSQNDTETQRNQPKNHQIPQDKVQTELAEIMNDFKNNVHTIAQTELLVAEWQNRNDVQKSFKEKQEALSAMRVKYEQIQRDMKCGSKKASAFERIKKLFIRSSSKEEEKIGYPHAVDKNDIHSSSQRPISSLSLQSTTSSSSSGRMSIISGCSLGDSGTHSDHEERKNILINHTEDEFRNELNNRFGFNYMIPPTPKPVKSGMFANRFATIEERTTQAVPKIEDAKELETYYIQFPPNGSLVESETKTTPDESTKPSFFSNTDLNENSQEYMNFPIPPPKEEKMSHEYMNFQAP